jgi:prepilin-type N-terminal cleavage/methylation domain-containing protein
MPRVRRPQGGFTLYEMMVVIVILLIMGAMAGPYLFRAIRNYQMESSGRQIANMILRARYQAMQRNQRTCAVFQVVGPERRYGLDLAGPDNDPCNDAGPVLDPGEPYIVTGTFVQWWANDTPAVPPLTGLPAGYDNVAEVTAPASYRVTFSPRGTVMTDAGGGNWVMATTVQMITLVRIVPVEFDAVLVTVTPIGRIKLYRWQRVAGVFQWVEL